MPQQAQKRRLSGTPVRPLVMTKNKRSTMAHLKVRPFKRVHMRVFPQPVYGVERRSRILDTVLQLTLIFGAIEVALRGDDESIRCNLPNETGRCHGYGVHPGLVVPTSMPEETPSLVVKDHAIRGVLWARPILPLTSTMMIPPCPFSLAFR